MSTHCQSSYDQYYRRRRSIVARSIDRYRLSRDRLTAIDCRTINCPTSTDGTPLNPHHEIVFGKSNKCLLSGIAFAAAFSGNCNSTPKERLQNRAHECLQMVVPRLEVQGYFQCCAVRKQGQKSLKNSLLEMLP